MIIRKTAIYKTRSGVILTEIAGEYLLVAAKSLLSQCPYVTQINESTAFLWNCMENGMTEEELLYAVAEEYEIDDFEEAKSSITRVIQQFQEMNYLEVTEVEVETDENQN